MAPFVTVSPHRLASFALLGDNKGSYARTKPPQRAEAQCKSDMGERLTSSRSIARTGLSALLAVTLSFFCIALFPRHAGATDMAINDAQQAVKTAKYTLAEAESKLASLSSECTQLEAEIAEMQTKVDELAEQTIQAQDAMFAGRASLGEAMKYDYQNSALDAVLGVVFGSSDWSQFTKGVDYISSIMDSQAAEVENQKRLKAELEEVSGQLNAQKDEQEAKLGELEMKRDEAQDVVEQVTEEVASNTEKLNALKAQAAAIAQATQNTATETTGNLGGGNNGGGGNGNNGGNNGGGGGGGGAGWVAPMTTSWNSGYATAYNLFGNKTASGEVYNYDTSGVAIAVQTPGYGSLVRNKRAIQISYNGVTVTTRIIDGGGFAKYGNALDLTRAVHVALDPSATTAAQWGKRTVTYRLL